MSGSLVLEDVACVRGGRLLFEGVNLSLGAGEAAVVTGPNGVGKSSLLRVVAGLLAPSAGRVALDGSTALLGEAAALDPELELGAALRFWVGLDGRRGDVREAMTVLDLEALERVPVRLLSTGQRRRAALARVIASGASLWLLDEPANGLDQASVRTLEAVIARHLGTGGLALIATHLPLDVPHARSLAL